MSILSRACVAELLGEVGAGSLDQILEGIPRHVHVTYRKGEKHKSSSLKGAYEHFTSAAARNDFEPRGRSTG